MALSEELKELYASSGPDVILDTLEFTHSTFDAPIYIVNDWNDLNATLETGVAVTFQKYAFRFTPPNRDQKGSERLTLTIDNVSREFTEKLEGIMNGTRDPLLVTYRVYISSDLSGPQNDPPTTLNLINVVATNRNITGTATNKDLINTGFPNVLYDQVFQSLYYFQ